MRRPRSYLLKSEFDVEIEACISKALRELSRAEDACRAFSKTEANKGVLRSRLARLQQDIREARSRLDNVSSIHPWYDLDDKDLKD